MVQWNFDQCMYHPELSFTSASCSVLLKHILFLTPSPCSGEMVKVSPEKKRPLKKKCDLSTPALTNSNRTHMLRARLRRQGAKKNTENTWATELR